MMTLTETVNSKWISALENYESILSLEETNTQERFENEWKKLSGFKFNMDYFLYKSYRKIKELKDDLRLLNYFAIKMDPRFSILIIEIVLNCDKDEELDDLFADYVFINGINIEAILKKKNSKRVSDGSINYLF